ncbi:hypothetical protein SESBI_37543 [Sesbania bispinosa]|nr:hypothetical protein SESBI_37543 [Sesbania bispinosa]
MARIKDGQRHWVTGQKEVMEVSVNYFKEVFTSEGTQQVEECLLHIPNLVSLELNQKLMGESQKFQIRRQFPNIAQSAALTLLARLIQDNIMMAHEVFHFLKHRNRMVDQRVKLEMEDIFNIGCWESPDKYLGLPAEWARSKTRTLSWILNRIQWKLEGWKKNLLNMVGKEVLIKVVIQTIPSVLRGREVQKCRKTSWIWSSILEGRDLIKKHGQWLIATREDINIREDKWIWAGDSLKPYDNGIDSQNHQHNVQGNNPRGVSTHWKRPLEGTIKCNSDAAWSKPKFMTAIATLSRHSNGSLISDLARKIRAPSPLVAKAPAMREAITTTYNFDWTKRHILSGRHYSSLNSGNVFPLSQE